MTDTLKKISLLLILITFSTGAGIFLAVNFFPYNNPFRLRTLDFTSSRNISGNIMYLTSPVTSFRGAISKIEDPYIYVNRVYAISRTLTSEIIDEKMPKTDLSPVKKMITYKIKVTPSAKFFTLINKALPTETNDSPMPQPDMHLSDLKIGNIVDLSLTSDLRYVTEEIESSSVTLNKYVSIVVGEVTEIYDDKLIVSGIPVENAPGNTGNNSANPQLYNITLTRDSKFFHLKSADAEPTILTKSSIKKGTKVRILSYSDLNTSNMHADYLDLVDNFVDLENEASLKDHEIEKLSVSTASSEKR